MRIPTKTFCIVIALIFCTGKLSSQSLPETTVKKIDSLFENWNKENSPGCSVGIIRNDSLIFSKGYGIANLEYKTPISPETIFYMCSVSKQFTGYSIVLLARQGKIKLDEDIHVYLPWLKDFGKKITVRHLLNHTSGLRDDIALATISGLGTDGMLTQDLAINILKRQRTLNFVPGDQYSYSNSNFVLLAEIVKTVSGKSFRAFTDSAIFKPLGMTNSRFQDDYSELIKNRAVSYSRIDGNRFSNEFQNVYTLGDGGLFTNITDMSKWVTNFYLPKAGDAEDIKQLTEQGKLNNGKTIDYALGIAVENRNGKKVYDHGGALSGYRTFIAVFPELKMGFLVFGNVSDFAPWTKTFDLADLFIAGTKTNEAGNSSKTDRESAVLKDTNTVKKYVGSYISDDGIQMNFRLTNSKFYLDAFGRSFLMAKGTMDTFYVYDDPNRKILFKVSSSGETTALESSPDETNLLKKYITNNTPTDKELQAYTGVYYSPELGCEYGIILKEHRLFLTNNKYNDGAITVVDKDHLISDFWWMRNLLVIRNPQKQITGFEINGNRIKHLRFNKMNQHEKK